jgi:cell division septation protein DedD
VDNVAGLAAALEHEAYAGEVLTAAPRPRRRSGRWLAAFAVLVVGGGAALAALRPWEGARTPAAFENVPPAGTEPVLPAQLGPAGDAGLPDVAPGGTAGETAAPPAEVPVAGPPVEEAPAAPSPASDASAAPYRVHVASFRSEETVQRIADELRAKGLDAHYEPAPDAPGWYRVFVGRFATHEEAAAEAARLLARKLVDRAHAFPDPPR